MNKQLDYLNVAWEMWKKRSLFPQSKFWIQVNPKKSKIYQIINSKKELINRADTKEWQRLKSEIL